MHTLKTTVFALGLIFTISSCTINNKIHFNKDYSGTYEMSLELESLLLLASAMDSTQSMSEEDMINQMKQEMGSEDIAGKLNMIDGISNSDISVSKEEGFVISFDFRDIASLNQSFSSIQNELNSMDQAMGSDDEKETIDQFFVDGKTLTFRSPPTEEDELNALEMFGGEDDDLGGMGGAFEMNFDFSFDRKVKSVDAKGIKIISQEKKRILAEIDLKDVINSGGYELNVKLK